MERGWRPTKLPIAREFYQCMLWRTIEVTAHQKSDVQLSRPLRTAMVPKVIYLVAIAIALIGWCWSIFEATTYALNFFKG